MAYRLEIRFDYLCLFVPTEEGVWVVLPDLREAPLQSLKVGPHFPVFRWQMEQRGDVTPQFFRQILPRKAQHHSPSTSSTRLEVTELNGEDIEIRINSKGLEGRPPSLRHLASLTHLEECGLPSNFNFLHKGLLDPKPQLKEAPPNEQIGIAARILLKGGSFDVEYEGLSIHDFFLFDERNGQPSARDKSHAKKVARQSRWQSDLLEDEEKVHILFKRFGDREFSEFLHIRRPNLTEDFVSISLRNCDEKEDFLLPGLPAYGAISNYEPRVYQALSAGYSGLNSIVPIVHQPIPLSANGVCGPAQNSGAK